MEILFKTKNIEQIKKIILNDDILSRASIIFKESSTLGEKEGFYYILFSGTDEQCNRAKDVLTDKAEIIDNHEIIKKIKEEQDKAAEGFGAIFG
ncbi:MAG: hypothetical protein KQA41_02100 [Candidatus Aenigmarchaeota archaeon]|nr:hypothetical protein [Candidatus Aenigmarchaeota archaeon]MBU5688995.1 hypothetical protein [Candidatus Aenigmarchaeota archaeon]